MFQVSAEVYEVLSLALRYFFALFAAFLGLRGLLLTLAERREEKERLRHLPGAGTVGELVVLSGSRTLAADSWFPVPREGVLGSLRTCDLVVDCKGVAGHHLDFSWRDGVGLLLSPRNGRQVTVNDQLLDARTDPEAVPLTHGAVLRVGEATLRFLVFAALNPSGVQSFAPVPSGPPGTVPVQAYIAEEATPVPPLSPALPEAVPPPIVIPNRQTEATPPAVLPGTAIPNGIRALPQQPQTISCDPIPMEQDDQPAVPDNDPVLPADVPPLEMPTARRRPIAPSEVPVDSPYRRPGRHEASRPETESPAAAGSRRRSDRWKEDWSE